MSRVALALGGLGKLSTMASVWLSVVQDIRCCWQTELPLPLPPQPQAVSTEDSYALPYQHLWTDLTHVKLPDSSCCELDQRIQMLQLCILCRHQDFTVSCPNHWLPGSFHPQLPSQPLSSSCTAAVAAVPSEVDGEDTEFMDCQEAEEGVQRVGSPEARNRTIVPPRLQRRLPLCAKDLADLQALHTSLDKAIGETPASGGTEDYLGRVSLWQSRLPALVADIRAFKSVNPSSTLGTFIGWYCGGSGDVHAAGTVFLDVDGPEFADWRLMWDNCLAEEAQHQKPLFAAEREAEKALAALESVSVLSLASQLLSTGLVAVKDAVWADMKPLQTVGWFGSASLVKILVEFERQLHVCQVAVSSLVRGDDCDDDIRRSRVEVVLAAVDALSLLVDRLYLLALRVHCTRQLLGGESVWLPLAVSLAMAETNNESISTATASSPAEATRLTALCQEVSTSGHVYYDPPQDSDRPLGPPTRKVVHASRLVARHLQHMRTSVHPDDGLLRVTFTTTENDSI